MATIGKRSETCLESVKPVLRSVIRDALLAAPEWLDFAVICGKRTDEEQHARWLQGRDENGNVTDGRKIVTYHDGFEKRSKHQDGEAVDIVAYSHGNADWSEKATAARAAYIIGFAMARGIRLSGGVKWGWDFGHIEVLS